MDNDPICRFCLFPQESTQNLLISPCECKGTMKFVHLQCAKKWRDSTNNPEFYKYCQLCRTEWKSALRWPREEIVDFQSSGMYYYILSSYLPNIIVHCTFFYYVLYNLPKNPANRTFLDASETYEVLNERHCMLFYVGLLSSATVMYLAHFIPYIKAIKNKKMFIYYSFDIRVTSSFYHNPFLYIFLLHMCASLAVMNYYPFGVMYIALLSQYGDFHNLILRRINSLGEIF